MNIHEYQGKEILKKYGVRIQDGIVADTPEGAVEAYQAIAERTGSKFVVVKTQIHAGGRGKGKIRGSEQRGVQVVKSADQAHEVATNLLGNVLVTHQTGPEGKTVNKIFLAEDAYYPGTSEPKEFYVSILLDRAKKCPVIMASTEGGMDIEEVAENHPEKIIKEWIDPRVGLQGFQARKIAFAFGLSGNAFKEMVKFLSALYTAYWESDAAMFEINPVLKTSDDKIIAVDAKVSFLIKLSGGEPANFLDVGGGANAKTVEAGFRIILKDPNVKAILINIFGGIVRCDRVATGVVEAYKAIGDIPVPIIVRLQGTNAEEGARIINESGLKVFSAIEFKEAAAKVTEVLKSLGIE